MISLKEISKEDFVGDVSEALFMDDSLNQKYALVVCGNNSYKFAWYSDLIEPIFLEVKSGVVCVGVDFSLVIIDFNINEIKLRIKLSYWLINVTLFNENLIVCTELEVLLVDLVNFNVVKKIPLPEFYEKIEIDSKNSYIICVDKTKILIEGW